MSFPFAGGGRQRPAALSTSADLAADELAFFKSEFDEAVPPRKNPYAGLQPVKERVVQTRRRRRPQLKQTNAFPLAKKAEDTGSRFARKKVTVDEDEDQNGAEAAVRTGVQQVRSGLGVGGENDVMGKRAESEQTPSPVDEQIATMTPEQIAEAQQEIASVFSADSISFLRSRGRANHNSVLSTSCPSGPSSDPKSSAAAPPVSAAVATVEEEKRLWMNDATTPLPGDAAVDGVLSDAVSSLGELGARRFNLEGETLTPEEIAELPTHLGLHHHGAEPASAGYTLADLLLLTRSTIVGQRVIALRMLTALVRMHGDVVLTPLVESGGLDLAFAPFPPHVKFEAALTNRIAFVEAVEALVRGRWRVGRNELVPGLYFASRFYSGTLRERPTPLFEVLANSSCVSVLARIAKTDISRREGEDFALRSLAMIRVIVTLSPNASRRFLTDEPVVITMQQLAIGNDPLRPATALLACDALAQAIVSVAWNEPDVVEQLDKMCFSDSFIRRVTMPLTWFLRDARERPNELQCQAAKGAVRMLRAALTFERGLMEFTSCAPAICRLTREDTGMSAEAYLALEAYAHSLYAKTCTSRATEYKEGEGTANRPVDQRFGDSDAIKFVKDQLTELVPVALEASRIFVSASGTEPAIQKAAAGHFAATLLAISGIPIDQTVLRKLLIECSAASSKIQSRSSENKNQDLFEIQALASVSHAGARVLSRVNLDPHYVLREVQRVMDGVRFESRYLVESGRESICPWRPTANACAEWIGAFSKASCTIETIQTGVDLIPWISDPQVILDVLSRCVLRVTAIVTMNPVVTIERARRCAEDLLPLTFTNLCQMSGKSISSLANKDKGGEPATEDEFMVTMQHIMSLWIKHVEISDSFFCVASALFQNHIIQPGDLFRVLLNAPAELYTTSPELFDLLLAAGREAIHMGQPVLPAKEETIVSAISTAPNSELTVSVLSMTDFLVTRGPLCCGSDDKKDPLASVILSVMCGPEADASLREALWKRTVDECGGATLYGNAAFIFDENAEHYSTQFNEEDSMLAEYCAALVRGLLTGQRCPPVLGAIIVSTLGRRLQKCSDPKTLLALNDALRGTRRSVVIDSLQEMLCSVSDGNHHASLVSTWLNLVDTTE